MALAHCILGSFLGVGCHCFPGPLDLPTFASRCLHVQATSAKNGITGEKWPVNFACDFDFHVNPGFFDMPRKSATWETALLPPPKISTWQKGKLRRDRNPFSQKDSNPQSHTASCSRPRQLEFANCYITTLNFSFEDQGHSLCVEKRQNVFNRSSQFFINGACLVGCYNGRT